jgi:hypothetical protein
MVFEEKMVERIAGEKQNGYTRIMKERGKEIRTESGVL